MKTTHLLAGLLTIAAVLVDLVLASRLKSHPDAAFMWLWGVACGQLALLAVWNVWGSAAWLCRLLGVLAAAAWIGWPLADATSGRWAEWYSLLCLFMVAVSGPLYVARARGWRLCVPTAEGSSSPPSRAHWTQFSVGDLLSLMTLTGLVLGLRGVAAFPWRHLGEVVCYGMCLTGVASAAVWAMASRRTVAQRVGVLGSICLAAGWAMFGATGVRDPWYFTMVVLAEAMVICLGLTILQAAGLLFDLQKSCRST